MLKVKINLKESTTTYLLPTEFSEITAEYLKDITKEIDIAEHYTLVGLAFYEDLLTVITNANKGNMQTNVIPIYIKSGKTDCELIKRCQIKDKLIISGTDIARGYHIVCKNNKLTMNNIVNAVSLDNVARAKILSGQIYKDNNLQNKTKCWFIEFKLIPNNDIHGRYELVDESYVNPFIQFERKTNDDK